VNFVIEKEFTDCSNLSVSCDGKGRNKRRKSRRSQKEKDNNKNNKKVLFCVFVSWVFRFLAVWRESNGDDACEEAGTSSSLLCTWEIEQQSYYH
jgi:hypothetical protein